MSFELYMFKKLEGQTVVESVDEVLESDEVNALTLDEFNEQKKKIVQKLVNMNTSFECFDSEEELELFDEKLWLTIAVHPNQIALSISYGWSADNIKNLSSSVFWYIVAISEITNYSIYDQQIDQEISSIDWKDMLEKSLTYALSVV